VRPALAFARLRGMAVLDDEKDGEQILNTEERVMGYKDIHIENHVNVDTKRLNALMEQPIEVH
jgi:hypothetical protein